MECYLEAKPESRFVCKLHEQKPGTTVDRLTLAQLDQLRCRIFDNAEALYQEGQCLLQHGHFARAYLLAHFSIEELGKLPIIVGAVGKLLMGDDVDWKKLRRRLRSHVEKLRSNTYHHYVFGLELDLIRDSDVKWLDEERAKSAEYAERKNRATYVDVRHGSIEVPTEQVTKQDAERQLNYAFESLKAHWQSEKLSNRAVRGP